MKNIRSIVIAGITAVMAFSVCSCDSYLDVDRYIYDMTSQIRVTRTHTKKP